MAESTLSLTLDQLQAEVGQFLGWGHGGLAGFTDSAWPQIQAQIVANVVASGLRQFYFPPALDGENSPYEWSFLKPTATVTMTVNQATVALPDNFGGFEGYITVQSQQNQVTWPVPLRSEAFVREKYAQLPTETGRPMFASLQPLPGTSQSAGQRWQMYVWPLPDQAYNLQFEYYLLNDALTELLPFSYGGMAHSETILESCLAIAERRLDDASNIHQTAFMDRLRASVGLDRRFKAENLGYNRDRSDGHYPINRGWVDYQSTVLVNGVQY
jgi:hypothetical protein